MCTLATMNILHMSGEKEKKHVWYISLFYVGAISLY